MECDLQVQLKRKLEALSDSIKKQKNQLERIIEILHNAPMELNVSQEVNQQQQQQQICEDLEFTIKEQERQCHKLKIILEGKVRVYETKRRVTELREKSRWMKSVTEASNRERPNNDTSMLEDNSTPSASTSFSPKPGLNSGSSIQPESGFSVSNTASKRIHESDQVETVKRECDVEAEPGDEEQRSLQRQLRQLQQQQDVLNAQGMALATQGDLSPNQLELLQTLLLQQQMNTPLGQQQPKNEEALNYPAPQRLSSVGR